MAKVSGDPSELRRFARDLNRFNNDLEGLVTSLHGRLVDLGRTWQDQEHRKFSEQFEQATKVLSRFVEDSNEHVTFLNRKAQHLEEYLNQH
jgi:uncharacterized protein YukE